MAAASRKAAILAVVVGILGAFAVVAILKRGLSPGKHVDNSDAARADIYDFGKAADGEAVHHVFRIINDASDEMELRVGPPSCGCTVADLDQSVLRAGEAAEIRVAVDTSGRSGKFESTVPVIRRFPLNPNRAAEVGVLVLRGVIADNWGARPSRVNFGQLRRGGGATTQPLQIIVENDQSAPPKLSFAEPVPFMDVRLGERVSVGGKAMYPAVLTVRPDDAPETMSNFSIPLQVEMQAEGKRRDLKVAVFGWIDAIVRAEPKLVYWDDARGSKTRTITLDAVDGGEINVIDVSARDQGVVRWDIVGDGSATPKIMVSRLPLDERQDLARTELNITVLLRGKNRRFTFKVPVLAF